MPYISNHIPFVVWVQEILPDTPTTPSKVLTEQRTHLKHILRRIYPGFEPGLSDTKIANLPQGTKVFRPVPRLGRDYLVQVTTYTLFGKTFCTGYCATSNTLYLVKYHKESPDV